MKRLIIISVLFLLFNSCSKDDSMFDPTYFGDGFKGITFTLESGPEPMKADPTDWLYYISYNTHKVNGITKTDVEIKAPNGYMFGPAYPNPTMVGYGFKIRFGVPRASFIYLYLINSDYRVIEVIVNSELEAGMYESHVESIGTPGVYRLIMETDGVYSKGDIWIKGDS